MVWAGDSELVCRPRWVGVALSQRYLAGCVTSDAMLRNLPLPVLKTPLNLADYISEVPPDAVV